MQKSQKKFVENLLKNYKIMQAELKNIQRRWNQLEREKVFAIEGQQLQAQNLARETMKVTNPRTGKEEEYNIMIPSVPRCGYKNYNLLMPYEDKEYADIVHEQSCLKENMVRCQEMIESIEDSLNSLFDYQKKIIELYYFQKLSITQITLALNYKDRWVLEEKSKALYNLYKILKVYKKKPV